MAANDLNKAENSAAIVRVILSVFIILIIIGTILLVFSTEIAEIQLIFILLGTFYLMSVLLLLFMWDSIYQMLSHIANPGRRAGIIGTTRRGYDPTAKIRGPPPF